MSRFILFVCLSLWPGLLLAADTILVVGDSLSAGYGIGQDQSWPSLLGRRLAERGLPYRVVNASVSGDTSASGVSRLPAALKQHRPRVVVIALGGNDGLRGLPPTSLRDNLAAMAAQARATGASVVVAGMDMPPNYGDGYREKFRRAYVEASAKSGAILIPLLLDGFAAERDYFQPDGIHPTAAAQPLIVETVWRALAPLLNAKAVTARPGGGR